VAQTYPDSATPPRSVRRFAKLLIRGFAAFFLLILLVVAVLLALSWWDHRTEITLPAPTGHFAVGRTSYTWSGDPQTDGSVAHPQAKRELLVWIWYPSSGSHPAAEYLPRPWREAVARTSGVLMSQVLTRDPSLVHAHSLADSDISPEQESYPVVILRAGGGALTTDYTTLAEDLASHGYVVVGFDAPYRTFVVVFPDGRVVARPPENNPENLPPDQQERLIEKLLPMWTSDTQFVVERLGRLNAAGPSGKFTGRLDMQKLGIFGHSFGGATALQFCHDDSRCKAGIDIDGDPYGSAIREGATQPFFFLLSDHGDLSGPETREVFARIQSVYDRLPSGKLLLMIRGANHFSFSDQILVKSRYVVKLMQLLQGGIDQRRGLAITTACVHTFFDVYLKGGSPTLLDNLRRDYPEVQSPAQQR
jgi:dienelactone hydrolase